MSYCSACGTSVEGRFCPKCGSAAGAPMAAGFAPAPAYASAVPLAPAAPATAGLSESAAGTLCYLGGLITGIIFLVIPPYNQNPRIRFHAFQAIFFHVAWVAGWIALFAVRIVLPFGLSIVMGLVSLLFWGGGLLLWLFLMWKANQGESFSLPVIGGIARQQAGK